MRRLFSTVMSPWRNGDVPEKDKHVERDRLDLEQHQPMQMQERTLRSSMAME